MLQMYEGTPLPFPWLIVIPYGNKSLIVEKRCVLMDHFGLHARIDPICICPLHAAVNFQKKLRFGKFIEGEGSALSTLACLIL